MNFGFVTGDGSTADAFFYTTAYPTPDNLTGLALSKGSYWHTEGWTGAILPDSEVELSGRPQELVLEYLQKLQGHGRVLMS